MNFKLVLKTYSQLRQLTNDETALLETLRGMTDTERELLAETLGPPVKVKVVKPGTKRNVEYCAAEKCGYTRRAVVHKDSSVNGYHEFVAPSSPKPKSARASSLAEKIAGTAGNVKKTDDDHDYDACMAIIDDNGGEMTCGRTGDDNIHHKRTDPDFHPFTPSASVARRLSSQMSGSSEGEQLSTQSSEAETASASSVTGG